MKKLKRTKSLLAILLALCICATLPIATVFAEDENDSVDVMASSRRWIYYSGNNC